MKRPCTELSSFVWISWMSSTYSKLGSRFARATVTYIGKVIVEGQVQPMGVKVQAIHFLPSKLKNELKKNSLILLVITDQRLIFRRLLNSYVAGRCDELDMLQGRDGWNDGLISIRSFFHCFIWLNLHWRCLKWDINIIPFPVWIIALLLSYPSTNWLVWYQHCQVQVKRSLAGVVFGVFFNVEYQISPKGLQMLEAPTNISVSAERDTYQH